MSKKFTPEELEIMRRTQEEGEELAAREEAESGKPAPRYRPLVNSLVFIAIFFLFVFLGFIIVRLAS